mmetsp:Transcript_14135/g.20629  ORF Transcript_14135/g.20629 Transcript_14135/m.20629 type:complete len:84 (-) Transcript_14135:143-394(-)|eukprot:CAMPEP_0195517010 /NCGR_PEP_ID=MMETSP0794_2-20130614/9510_1 /TAXON_ID=515487 /ORGANISM="Stephanopyxis turris, Strain CCMP 815" /LENGTH=83 /DNA_ID=CAMNT_0040645739 /DNA_START=252 /DNA_END=503 /DNA_ORIENTATION=+
MKLEVSDRALDYLVNVGFDPNYGARPLKRTIQRKLETPMARGILSGKYGDGDSVMVDVENDLLTIKTIAMVEATNEDSWQFAL